MKKTMTFIAAMTALASAGIASADVTYTSTWDDQSGPAMLTSFDGSNDNLTFGYANEGYLDSSGFFMQEAGLAGDAVYLLAKQLEAEGDKIAAMEYYKKILIDYKSSIYLENSRNAYRKLRGDRL
jgi:hypothetical protein